MTRVPLPVAFLAMAVVYALVGRLGLELAGEVMAPRAAALFVGIAWLVGWVWLVGALIGGPKSGWLILRTWLAFNVGMLLAVGPFALVPHPLTLGIGITLAVGFVTWCLYGRWESP